MPKPPMIGEDQLGRETRDYAQEVTMATNRELGALFGTVAHPKRLAILLALEDNELCVGDLEELLDLRQAYISQQLTVLREAGLVCYRRNGWNVHYRIARPEVYTLLEMAVAIYKKLGICAVTPEELSSGEGACQGRDVKEKATG